MGLDIIGYRDTSMAEVFGYYIHVEAHLPGGCSILVSQPVRSQLSVPVVRTTLLIPWCSRNTESNSLMVLNLIKSD